MSPVLRLLTACTLVLATSLAHAAWQAPLSSSEANEAVSTAIGSTTTQSKVTQPEKANASRTLSARSLVNPGTPDTSDSLGRQVLLVELKPRKKQSSGSASGPTPRVAEVFVFDYDTLTTELHRVNVDQNQLIETLTVDSVHLPLNELESAVARSLLSEHAPTLQALAAEFQASFNRTLDPLNDLDMKVSIWQPGAHQSGANPVAQACQTERCALVSIFTTGRYSFSIEPVVNLVQKTIHLGVIQ